MAVAKQTADDLAMEEASELKDKGGGYAQAVGRMFATLDRLAEGAVPDGCSGSQLDNGVSLYCYRDAKEKVMSIFALRGKASKLECRFLLMRPFSRNPHIDELRGEALDRLKAVGWVL